MSTPREEGWTFMRDDTGSSPTTNHFGVLTGSLLTAKRPQSEASSKRSILTALKVRPHSEAPSQRSTLTAQNFNKPFILPHMLLHEKLIQLIFPFLSIIKLSIYAVSKAV